MDGSSFIAKCLRELGVEYMFGIVGVPVLDLGAHTDSYDIKFLGFRNEQAASYAAGAYGFLTGTPGVCLSVSGPGMVHCIAGLANAQANCWPMILISGANDSNQDKTEAFQETPHIEAARPFVKYAARVNSVERIPFFLEQAYRHSIYGRPGPVFLEVPEEVLEAQVTESIKLPSKVPPPPLSFADPKKIAEVVEALRAAKNPLVIVGKGAAYARAEVEVRELIKRTNLPFLPTPMGKGVVSDTHPNCVAANRTQALLNADLIILVGARLNWILHFGQAPRFSEKCKFVQIDISAEEMGQNVEPLASLVGDARVVVQQLNEQLEKKPWSLSDSSSWWGTLREKIKKNKAQAEELQKYDQLPMNYYRAMKEIKDVLPQDFLLISEGANTMDISRSVFDHTRPRTRLDAGSYGTMGVGLGFCIAASVVEPKTKIVAIQGDSAFGFSAMELDVAARYNLPITVIIINNNGIYGGLPEFSEGMWPPSSCLTPNTHYERIVEAFGGKGYFATTPEQVREYVADALKQKVPTVVNVMIEPSSARKEQTFSWLTKKAKL